MTELMGQSLVSLACADKLPRKRLTVQFYLSRDMRFPTMWYVRPAKPQISLRICAV